MMKILTLLAVATAFAMLASCSDAGFRFRGEFEPAPLPVLPPQSDFVPFLKLEPAK